MAKSIDPAGYGISKSKTRFMKRYEPFFAPLVGKSIRLLELGVYRGASLRFWRDYFENATIVGLDCNPVHVDDSTGMIHVYQGRQQDTALLDRVAQEQAPDGFDVIIDDCSHIGRYARISFWHLFQNHLKPGGLYVIEDWQTGYSSGFLDGRYSNRKPSLKYPLYAHLFDIIGNQYPYIPGVRLVASRLFFRLTSRIPSQTNGMAGFIKELPDACFLGKRAIPRSGAGRYFDYGIYEIHINFYLVFVVKSKEKDVNKIDEELTKNGKPTPFIKGLIAEEDSST